MRLGQAKAAELLARHDVPFTADASAEPAGSLVVSVDPATHKVLVMLSRKAVQSWGELAARNPREAARDFLEAGERAHGHTGRELARRAGFRGADHGRLERLVLAAHRIFSECECVWVDLRFARLKDSIVVTRAELELDGSALFRHPDLQGAVEPPVELPRSERERTAQAAGIEYLDLGGDLGILPGGIGFGMAALDIVSNTGGSAADVMDSGGEVTAERLRVMMDLVLDNPKVSVAFCCRYAGLTKAYGWARLMIRYLLEKGTSKPVVLRVAGNDEEAARRLFEEAAAESPEVFKRVWTFFSSTPADNAAREAVALAEMIRKGEDPFAEGPEDEPEAGKPEGPPPANGAGKPEGPPPANGAGKPEGPPPANGAGTPKGGD